MIHADQYASVPELDFAMLDDSQGHTCFSSLIGILFSSHCVSHVDHDLIMQIFPQEKCKNHSELRYRVSCSDFTPILPRHHINAFSRSVGTMSNSTTHNTQSQCKIYHIIRTWDPVLLLLKSVRVASGDVNLSLDISTEI